MKESVDHGILGVTFDAKTTFKKCLYIECRYSSTNTDRDFFTSSTDSCAPFKEKLMKRPLARWVTETIKTEIKK